MAGESRVVTLPPDSDLAHRIRDAVRSGESVVVSTGDAVYSLAIHLVDDGEAALDAARSTEGILKAAGTWQDLDAEAFKAYIRERRRASRRAPVRL